MKFNRYIFDLYLQGDFGKENLFIWTEFLNWQNWYELEISKITNSINSSLYTQKQESEIRSSLKVAEGVLSQEFFNENQESNNIVSWLQYKKSIDGKFDFKNDTELVQDAKGYWNDYLNGFIEGFEDKKASLSYVCELSIFLTILNPHFLFPYFFVSQFWLLQKVFEEFDIVLPELPKNQDYKARLDFYLELCEVFYFFRKQHDLSPQEFFSFLYGFVGNIIKEELTYDEKALNIWITGGSKTDYEELKNNSSSHNNIHPWTSNLDAKKSDLQLIYFRTPYSGIGAISRCLSDGFFDPFDYYSNRVFTSNIKLFKLVSLKELQSDSVWKHNSLVRSNMQGVKGQKVIPKEYEELRKILTEKTIGVDIFPDLESVVINTDLNLLNERDVEVNLLEPLLIKMGHKPENWIRQLPVRMGRGERNYPDYALFVNNKIKGEETAKFLWEAKYRIIDEKQLRDCFFQGKSYARRLDSEVFGLVAVEGIWVSSKKDGFEFNKMTYFSWSDLIKPENWSLLCGYFR